MSNEFIRNLEPENLGNSSFLLSPTVDVLDKVGTALGSLKNETIVRTVDFAAWCVQSASHNLDVYGIKPGSHVGLKMSSPVLESVKNEITNEEWFESVEELLRIAKDDGHGKKVNFENFPTIRKSLDDISRFTGIDRHLVLNHFPYGLAWALRSSFTGMTIISFDMKTPPAERLWSIWDTKYNRKLTEDAINDAVEIIDDEVVDRVLLPAIV